MVNDFNVNLAVRTLSVELLNTVNTQTGLAVEQDVPTKDYDRVLANYRTTLEGVARKLRLEIDKYHIDNRAHNDPHAGYVYVIYNPRKLPEYEAVWVGKSSAPWENIYRALMGNGSTALVVWLRTLKEEILQEGYSNITYARTEVVERFFESIEDPNIANDPIRVQEDSDELYWLPWKVVSDQAIAHRDSGAPRNIYHEVLDQLIATGHPIITKRSGRPKLNK